MREIKFRGRNSKGWLYGNLIRGCITSILTEEEVASTPIDLLGHRIVDNEVEENTIGQSVGLRDKNGKEIYEGDIVRTTDQRELVMIVAWNDKLGGYGLVTKEMWKDRKYSYTWRTIIGLQISYEVIGNIYDNKEMLEE